MINSTVVMEDQKELKSLMAEYPDLPLVFAVDSDLHNDDFSSCWLYGSIVRYKVGEILDVEPCEYGGDIIYDSRDDFLEFMYDRFSNYTDQYKDMSDKEYDEMIEKEVGKYDPYWKPAIIVYVS